MANTLTALAPVLYSAGRVVPKELSGFLQSSQRNWDDKGVAKGDTVKVPVVPKGSLGNVTPAQTWTVGSDTTPTTRSLTLSNEKEYTFHLTGEEERSLANGGDNAREFFRQSVEQGIRELRNTIEADVATTADVSATRGRGTAGTNPFASDLDNVSLMKKLLDDLGAPQDDRHLIINTTAGKELRDRITVGFLAGAQTRGETTSGEILNLHGFRIKESAQVQTHTAGTGSGYLVNLTAGYSAGDTSLEVDTGSGTIVAGDMISFTTGDTDYFGVKTALTGTTVVLQDPGLAATVANNAVVNIAAAHTANIAMQRNALVSVIRPSIQPEAPDVEQMTVTDPETGFSFLMIRKVGSGLASYYMRVVYDSFAPNPEYLVKLIG